MCRDVSGVCIATYVLFFVTSPNSRLASSSVPCCIFIWLIVYSGISLRAGDLGQIFVYVCDAVV